MLCFTIKYLGCIYIWHVTILHPRDGSYGEHFRWWPSNIYILISGIKDAEEQKKLFHIKLSFLVHFITDEENVMIFIKPHSLWFLMHNLIFSMMIFLYDFYWVVSIFCAFRGILYNYSVFLLYLYANFFSYRVTTFVLYHYSNVLRVNVKGRLYNKCN